MHGRNKVEIEGGGGVRRKDTGAEDHKRGGGVRRVCSDQPSGASSRGGVGGWGRVIKASRAAANMGVMLRPPPSKTPTTPPQPPTPPPPSGHATTRERDTESGRTRGSGERKHRWREPRWSDAGVTLAAMLL